MLKNANLRAQRDLLLPKLISGELDVLEGDDQMAEAAAQWRIRANSNGWNYATSNGSRESGGEPPYGPR